MDISDLPAFKHDDLVELIEPVEVVSDEEHRAPGRRGHHHAEPGQDPEMSAPIRSAAAGAG